jgi:hypothetical protein
MNVIPDTPSVVVGVTLNPDVTQIWAFAVSGRARKKAAQINNKSESA